MSNESTLLKVEEDRKKFIEQFGVLNEIALERKKQDEKWGVQNHIAYKWNAILVEEVGEVSKSILDEDYDNYREELIQVAAVAVAAIECMDRQRIEFIRRAVEEGIAVEK